MGCREFKHSPRRRASSPRRSCGHGKAARCQRRSSGTTRSPDEGRRRHERHRRREVRSQLPAQFACPTPRTSHGRFAAGCAQGWLMRGLKWYTPTRTVTVALAAHCWIAHWPRTRTDRRVCTACPRDSNPRAERLRTRCARALAGTGADLGPRRRRILLLHQRRKGAQSTGGAGAANSPRGRVSLMRRCKTPRAFSLLPRLQAFRRRITSRRTARRHDRLGASDFPRVRAGVQ